MPSITMPTFATWLRRAPPSILHPNETRLYCKIVTSHRYVRVLAISLPPYGVFQVLCKFLQTQGLNNDILLSSFAGVVVHAAVVYALVFHTPLGYMGAAWATTITLLALDAILFTIIIKKCAL